MRSLAASGKVAALQIYTLLTHTHTQFTYMVCLVSCYAAAVVVNLFFLLFSLSLTMLVRFYSFAHSQSEWQNAVSFFKKYRHTLINRVSVCVVSLLKWLWYHFYLSVTSFACNAVHFFNTYRVEIHNIWSSSMTHFYTKNLSFFWLCQKNHDIFDSCVCVQFWKWNGLKCDTWQGSRDYGKNKTWSNTLLCGA